MGRIKDWMMDMEENIVSAIESGATSTSDVVAFVNTNMSLVDEKFVAMKTQEIMGPMNE